MKRDYDFQAPDLEELVTWADIVDGALYESAQSTVEMNAPAMKITLVVEGSQGPSLVKRIICLMQSRSLAEIIAEPEIQAEYQRLHQTHLDNIKVIRQTGSCDRGVIYFDLVDYGIEGYNKFIPYYLFPDSAYTVSISTSSFRTKVSVGSNPWARDPLQHNLASICERYGGGGHPKVGAISFPIGAVVEARRAAAEIQEELKITQVNFRPEIPGLKFTLAFWHPVSTFARHARVILPPIFRVSRLVRIKARGHSLFRNLYS